MIKRAGDPPEPQDAAAILEAAADTFRDRNTLYGNNYRRTASAMAHLFPDGIALVTADNFLTFVLFTLIMNKLTRFASTGLTHRDSLHDLAVYAAILESEMSSGPMSPIVSPDELPE